MKNNKIVIFINFLVGISPLIILQKMQSVLIILDDFFSAIPENSETLFLMNVCFHLVKTPGVRHF